MNTYMVSGADGVTLHVKTTGNSQGPPIVFLHGLSQCWLAWSKQMESPLAGEFQLVAMDLRGHGQSEKPQDAYGAARVWAEDVDAVIRELELRCPVLCGWSYAGVIMSDYIRQYGEENIAGTVWVSAISRLGDALIRPGFIGRQFLAVLPGLLSENVNETVPAIAQFSRLCFFQPPSLDGSYQWIGYNAWVPSHVRSSMLARNVNNDDVVRQMRKPMFIAYGDEDAVIPPANSEHLAGLAQHARVSRYPKTGHAPFWECPERFNAELAAFVREIWPSQATGSVIGDR